MCICLVHREPSKDEDNKDEVTEVGEKSTGFCSSSVLTVQSVHKNLRIRVKVKFKIKVNPNGVDNVIGVLLVDLLCVFFFKI